ncbi:DUF11 domain-containing protein [Cognatiluteimonas lumbrici]|uniref:DUF11 domain-containing protein n=1 Tax=Cognatiluteimonas lumbrici TaxID=2559601 RepID=UPI0015E40E23|nr:DUF11 domain-containing protein [Luteimonas lumbrici]
MAISRHGIRWLAAFGLVIAGWLAPGLGQQAWAQTTTTCYPADAKGVDGPVDYGAYCWIDFSPMNLTQARNAAGQDFRVDLRGGAYLTFNLRITNQTPAGAIMEAVEVPSWTGAAFGNSAFIDIPGEPILYQDRNNQNGPQNTVTLSGLTLHANGATELPFVFVAADGESSNSGESVVFTTTGEPWTLVSAPGISNPGRNMPVLSPATAVGNSTGSQSVTIDGVVAGSSGGVGSYVFTTDNSPGTVTAQLAGNGLQGALFGLKYHTIGLSLVKSHVGQFKAGGTGTYTLETANTVVTPEINPPTEPQPVRVVDTLPVGLTYVSADGGGFWTCSNVGQVVTCDAIALQDLTFSRTFPPINLTVDIASDAPSSVTNTAEISDPTTSTLVFNVCEVPDNGVCPGAATSTDGDVTAILHSDLSTSTKTVLDRNSGDANPGDVLEYTITLVESAGIAATNVSVTDDMPANVGNLTVTSKPAGITDNSSASGGANGTGRIDMSGISIPAGGSVSIVYRVTIAGGTAPGTLIENGATVTNGDPEGTGATPSAPPVTVSQSAMPSSGNKQLYLLTGPVNGNLSLTRTRPSTNNTMTWGSGDGQYQYFRLPALAGDLELNSPNVSVDLRGRRSGGGAGQQRRVSVQLFLNSTGNAISGASAEINFNSAGYTTHTFNLTLDRTEFDAGDQIILRVRNRDSSRVQFIERDGSEYSFVNLDAATVINVDDIGFFSAQYPSTAQKTHWEPGDTVYIRADISDPFGGFDVSAANSRLTLADADGGPLILNNVSLTPRTNPTEGNGVPNRILEYAYTLPASPSFGTWTATVTGSEGLENTITHSRNASFEVVPKALDITKSHTGNFIAGSDNSYTLTVGNTGGAIAAGTTTTVLDTLAPGLTFVSGTGTGWTCSAAGQDVTCTSTAAIPAGGNMAPITLTVHVDGSVGGSVDNQASVGNSSIGGGFQKPGNVDTATVLHPDLSTSTKSVTDLNGGDAAPGDVLRYTITLTESAGATAANVSVSDPLPANTTNLTVVSLPPGSVDASNATQLSVSGITVPANSSVQVVFDVTVANVAPGATIDNTATISNPGGPSGNPVAPTVVVLQSQIIEPQAGTKVLYLYDTPALSRVRTAASATSGVTVTPGGSGAVIWTLAPALAKNLAITRPGTVAVSLPTSATCNAGIWCFLVPNPSATVTVELLRDGIPVGTSASQVISGTSVATRAFTIPLAGATPLEFTTGQSLAIRISSTSTNADVQVYQYNGARATASFHTSTVINVDSVGVFSEAYPSMATKSQYVQGDTLYLRTKVSDPFGSADINRAELTLKDAGGTVLKDGEAMAVVDSTAAEKFFETAYVIPGNPRIGGWTAEVLAVEGEEVDGGGNPAITHEGLAYATVHGLVTLTKVWVNAADGHAVDLAISGGSSATAGSAVVTTPVTPPTPAEATAAPGATLTLTETFTSGSSVNYAKALTCTKASDSSAIPVTGTGASRSITMPDDSAVACVWTNTWMDPLTVVKASAVAWDPVNGFNNPKAIPGALVEYQITVINPAVGPIDADTLFVTDALPENVALRLDFDTPGSGPVSFAEGGGPSGLGYTFTSLASNTDDIAFSNDGGTTWNYVPVADAEGFDPAVDAIRINPKGAFEGGGGQFTLKFRVKVQ